MSLLPSPRRREIDHRTLKLIVGVIALSLPVLTSVFAKEPLPAISAAYWEGDWSRNILIGFLFAIAAFLFAYNGLSRPQMVSSKVAAIAALIVALFPCECGGHEVRLPYLHYAAAATMFFILAFFCYEFYVRARSKGHPQAMVRAFIYAVCGIAILVSILVMGANFLLGGALEARIPRLTFFEESEALLAFGISWLIASRVLPLVTRPDERYSPFRDRNPE